MASKSRKYILLWFLFELVLGLLAQLKNGLKQTIPNRCGNSKVPTSHCHVGWLTTAGTKTCVRKYAALMTFYEADNFCIELGARLYTSTSETQLKWVIEKFQSERVWVGLSDEQSEGVWRWSNGEPFQAKFWNDGEGNSGSRKNCGFLVTSKFADDSCTRDRQFLCQKSSRRGPRQFAMVVHWHGESVFFEGLPATVSCTAFFPENDKFTWQTSINKNMYTHGGPTITHEEVYEMNNEGECGKRVTSNYTYTAVMNLRNLRLACYARMIRGSICPEIPHKDAYCFNTPVLRVIENTGTPNPNQLKPGPVQMEVVTQIRPLKGLSTTITCTSIYSPGGIIKWMVRNGRSEFFINGLSVRNSHVMRMHQLGKMANQTVLTFEFKPYEEMEGTELICYNEGAYIGTTYRLRTWCTTIISMSGACAKSRPLTMQEDQYTSGKLLQPSNKSEANTRGSPSQPDSNKDIYVRPQVTMKYKGAPGPIPKGYPVLVECTLEKRTVDEPVWIIRPSEAHFLLYSKIFEHSTRTQYSNKEGTNKHSVTLTYVFRMTKKISGTTFDCYAYDVNKEQKKTQCNTTTDQMCDTTEPLELAEEIGSQNNQFDKTSVVMNTHTIDGVHFLGGSIVATCESREIVDGKFVWVLKKDETLINVYTKEHDKVSGEPKENGTHTSTLTLNATESLNDATLTCYSVHFMYYHGCPMDSSPNYCRTSRPICVVDGPKDTPKVTISYPGYPGAAQVGTILTSNCIVHSGGENDTFLWVVYMKDRTIPFKRDGEMVKHYSVQTDKNGTQLINSTIEFTVKKTMNGMQIACFAYDPGQYQDTIECIDVDKYCYISRKIQVVERPPDHSLLGAFTLVLASLVLLFACAMAWTLRERSLEHGEDPKKGPDTSLDRPAQQTSTQIYEGVSPQTQAANLRTSQASTTIF